MSRKSKKNKFTEKQLDALFECWKDADNYQDRLKLIEQRLPDIPALPALGVMRKLAKNDPKWLRSNTRKKNQKEREKLEKQQVREKKIAEKENKKREREERRQLKTEKKVQKIVRTKLLEGLDKKHVNAITLKIEPKFFFCQEVQQYVHNIPCVFRVFSKEFETLLPSSCEKCKKMDEYIKIIEEIVDGGQKTVRRYKTRKGSKNTKETASKAD